MKLVKNGELRFCWLAAKETREGDAEHCYSYDELENVGLNRHPSFEKKVSNSFLRERQARQRGRE